MEAEIWNPVTEQWRTLDRLTVPRNYHSIGILLKDGRVLAGGGGALCDKCAENHQDGQIFSPPYLFAADGSPASRPSITSAPSQTQANGIIHVTTDRPASRFTMIRLSGVTHSINTDQRFVSVEFDNIHKTTYELFLHENPNVLIPGNYWLFAIDNNGTPSKGQLINIDLGIANHAPLVNDPGDQEHRLNSSVELQINAFDDEGDPLSFAAEHLPQGLTIDAETGLISGDPQEVQSVMASISVSDGNSVGETEFRWKITPDEVFNDIADDDVEDPPGSGKMDGFILLLGLLFLVVRHLKLITRVRKME